MILLIDNYDSFVYNLARYVAELGEEPVVRRNDALSLDEVGGLAPSHIVDLARALFTRRRRASRSTSSAASAPSIPILGVCLGHQAIGAAYGGQIVRATRPMHGKTSRIAHDGTGVFAGLPSPLVATRYHSLVIAPESVPRGPAGERGVRRWRDHGCAPRRSSRCTGCSSIPSRCSRVRATACWPAFSSAPTGDVSGLPTSADGGSAESMPSGGTAPGVVPPLTNHLEIR